MISSTVEDYLKAFLKLEDMNEKASTSNLARHLSVADASVTDMLRKLQKTGLLEYTPYYGATLTAEGRRLALRILRRHRLIELFLHQIMGYGWEQVHDEAEKLEHVVSDFFVERIDAFLGHPDKDPHGEVIPDARGFRSQELDICLLLADPGEYTVRKVTNDRPEFLAYLEKESLTPGRSFVLLERGPFHGPLKLLLDGRKEAQYFGLEAAKSIYVLPAGQLHGEDRSRKERHGKTIAFPIAESRSGSAAPSRRKRDRSRQTPGRSR
ncbi:MAG: metal-dependent transcriptional regulator [Acidobacteria bacterium]|nr:metal-dependent transcriptional regulator [Acidobacteriota bacterium]MCI0718962.1 metal-dependent transcriptional regulator [Acidobacteriota bacterium]